MQHGRRQPLPAQQQAHQRAVRLAPAQVCFKKQGDELFFELPEPEQLSSLACAQLLAAFGVLAGAGRHEEALQLTCLVADTLWPPDSDPAALAAKRQLRQNRWIPAFGAAAQQTAPLSAAARALDADLRRHCPELTLADVRCMALQLRVRALDRLLFQQEAATSLSPAELARQQAARQQQFLATASWS